MDKEKLALAITKALAYTENGGKPGAPKAGKSGEMKSIFQFTPATWKLYSKQVLGQDNVPLTNESEAEVVHKKVSDWLDHGFKPEQIASMWNAGERRPDAYKENLKGTNKYGVEYDTPAYAKKVADYTKQFESEADPSADTQAPETETAPKQMMGQKQSGMIPRTPVAPSAQMPDSVGGLLKMGGVPQA